MSVTSRSSVLPGALAGIKRRGGRLLAVGDAAGQRAVCNRLFGDESADRTQVRVQSSGDEHDCQCSSDEGDVVALEANPNSKDRLSVLADVIVAAVDRRAACGLDPAELRVCLGPLDPLLFSADVDRVSRFLETVLDRVRRERGIVHAHYAGPVDTATVHRLERRFDARIEVQSQPDPRQRWYLTDANVTSNWLPLTD